jgi:hypothetical protein
MNEDNARAHEFRRGLTEGDVNILKFLAAAEILETDRGNSTTNLEESKTAKSREGVVPKCRPNDSSLSGNKIPGP